MFYGGTIPILISSKAPVQLPMWMNEGIAEYAALKWDNNSDNVYALQRVQNNI